MLGAAISARFPPRPAVARLAPLPVAAGGVPNRALLRGRVARSRSSPLRVAGYANTPETRWYYVLYVLKFILYNTAMYYLSVQ